MSLSFPSNPTTGQTYQNWVWDGSRGSWQPNFGAQFVTSFNGRAGAVTLQPSDNTVGNCVLIASQKVAPGAPVATLTFTNLPTTFDEYLISVYGHQTDTGAVHLGLKLSTDNGSTWNDGGNNYYNTWSFSDSASTGNAAGWGSALPYLMIIQNVALLASNSSHALAYVPLLPINGISKYFRWESVNQNANGVGQMRGGGSLSSSLIGPINALRFMQTSGNISRGIFNVYGLARGSNVWS